ncbi:MAG TPA: VOC family protein [Acidimicrobiales bacterium]|nr:VOC family protein [Acidimicrobiales bacterium]
MAPFPALNHFALTISNLDRSIEFYERLFEVPPAVLIDEKTYRAAIWLEPMFALHEHHSRHAGDTFDELRIGLDHIAFGCTSREELESWPGRLDALGIKHGEILDEWYGSGLAFRDPDDIQLEFFFLAG